MPDEDNTDAVPVADIDRRIAEINARLADIEVECQRIDIERDVLKTLRNQAIDVGRAIERVEPDYSRMGPSDAIVALLRFQPGLTQREIIDRLNGHVRTQAVDAKANLSSTIFNLKRRKVIGSGAAGRLTLKEK